MQSVFVISLYEGSLLSQLMVPPKLAPFRTADEMIALIKKGSYRMVTAHPTHWYFEELKNSERSHFRSLREATINNPVLIVDSVQAALSLVLTGNYIQVEDNDGDGYLAAKEYDGLSYIFEGHNIFFFGLNKGIFEVLKCQNIQVLSSSVRNYSF